MAVTIDNIELDETNVEFNYASDFVRHTDRLVYLTGKAGTGKTTFLKYLKETSTKNVVILAPTGVAAINAGGQTIHSFFQLPFGPFVINDKRLRTSKDINETDETTIYNTFQYRDDKRAILEELELLIIDEISMVRCDTLDVIDRILRVFRKTPYLPFGGVQVILIGDTFQLPPIADLEQWEILKDLYDSPFFFSSKVLKDNKPIYIELKKIYRQKEHEFIDLLNKIRVNQITDIELNKLNQKYNPAFSDNGSDNHIILSTTNAQVNQTNTTKLGDLKSELKIFEGEITGTFQKDIRGNYVLPTELNLHLKVGAQVMILKNDTGEFKRYFNGKIGKVSSLDKDKIIVEFYNQQKVQIEKVSWNNVQYTWNQEKRKVEEKIIGTFTQYPLRLAWAITVHKSQGLTFENVYADLGSAFEDGQVYVALSRCTSYNGLILKSQIHRSKIKTNPKVIEFAKTETPSTLIVQELNSGRADFYYKKVREEIKALNFANAYDNFVKAVKFRNDIETDLFKTYFTISAERLSSHINKYKSEKRQNQLIKATQTYLQSRISELEHINQKLTEKSHQQNNAVKTLLDQISNLEKYVSELQKEKNILILKNNGLNTEISEVKSNHFESGAKIKELEDKSIAEKNLTRKLMTRIQELENRKWYEVLLSRKK
ncbi:PIF1-like helicase [bacterium A37T11]|nr:PIF1-like helicase [bacterium A37T11]